MPPARNTDDPGAATGPGQGAPPAGYRDPDETRTDGDAAAPPPGAAPDGPDLALLGHDIRSAVSDVLGGLRLIDLATLPDAAHLQVARARAAAETLARLLDTALAESDAMFPAAPETDAGLAETPLMDLLVDAERRWSAHAREIGMTVEVTRGPGLPPLIGIDRTQLERVLSNLLSNAIKYSGGGRVELDVHLTKDGGLVFAVRDEGKGFAPQVLDNLFRRGVRAPGDRRKGRGMGLHICKELVDRMGGALTVESSAQGACVHMTLPPSARRLDRGAPANILQADLTGAHVLLIEDSATNQILMQQMLQRMGAQVAIAPDGETGLAMWRAGAHDLALVDIELPGMSGLDVIREIRAAPGVAGHLPILAVTAYVLRTNRDAIFAAGADGILAKPVTAYQSFAHAVARVFQRVGLAERPAAGQPARAGDVCEPAPPQDDLYDPETLRHLMGIAGPGAEELMTRLKADLRTAYSGLSDGLSRADIPVVRARTHVLISLAGAIGARACQRDAERMNEAAHRRDLDALRDLAPEALDRLKRLIRKVAREQSRLYTKGAEDGTAT